MGAYSTPLGKGHYSLDATTRTAKGITMTTVLLTTLHDPGGKLIHLTDEYFIPISRLYDNYIIEVTEDTRYSDKLFKPNVFKSPAGNIGESRRNCLRRGLETDATHFHFIDFDRLLYWYMTYPEELKQVIRLIECDKFTIIGRTKAAFDSHPWYQRETEGLINRLYSQDNVDVLAASRGMNVYMARWILKHSTASNPACIDVEWCRLIKTASVYPIKYLSVNGLGYESTLLNIEKDWPDEVKLRTQHLAEVVRMLYG